MPTKELYLLAAAFHKVRLWEHLDNSELFAVQMPDGEILYACVIGRLGEHLALALFPGREGLDSYRLLYEAPDRMRESEVAELASSQDCVMCSFEMKKKLRPRDLEELRRFGLSFRGKRAFPLFQRFRPYKHPWYLEDATDEERLRQGLLAGLEIARRMEGVPVQQDMFHPADHGVPKEALGFAEGVSGGIEVPLLTRQKDGDFEWGKIRLPEPAEKAYPSPLLTDEIALAGLRKMARVGAWECGLIMYTQPTVDEEEDGSAPPGEPESAPYFPFLLFMVDHDSGLLLHHGLARTLDRHAGEMIGALAEVMRKHGIPHEFFVRDERTRALLAGVAGQLNIRLTLRGDLHFLQEAENSLLHPVDARMEKKMYKVLDELAEAYERDELPEEMLKELHEQMKAAGLPAAAVKKLQRVLEGVGNDAGGKTAGKKATGRGKLVPLPKLTREEVSAGSYVISVSLFTGCYRHIQISAGATLKDLHSMIQTAFGFDDDHLHAFFMDNKAWSDSDSYYSRDAADGRRPTDRFKLRDVLYGVGHSFKYIFDFGDDWRFQCKVLKQLQEETRPFRIVRSKGEAPPQYRSFDDEDDEEEEEEEEERIRFPEIFMKARLKKMYAKLPLPEETVSLLRSYFDAFANLYGIIPLSKALEIFNSQNSPISEADFMAYAEIARHEKHRSFVLGPDDFPDGAGPCVPMEREIVEDSLTSARGYGRVRAKQADRPYYVPDKRTLLKYADPSYYERTPQFFAMRQFASRLPGFSARDADDVADELRLYASMDEEDVQYILDEMELFDFVLSGGEETAEFVRLYNDLLNATRMPENRGHTPEELGIRIRLPVPSPAIPDRLPPEGGTRGAPAVKGPIIRGAPKVGRNDPCPCGSGKKYKRCCGNTQGEGP